MTKYRKKPVVIDAFKFEPGEDMNITDFPAWFVCAVEDGDIYFINRVEGVDVVIRTLEGEMTAREGDYIIMGIQAELYPCKADIFEATYELAE